MKKILFLNKNFYDYDKIISSKFRERGFSVTSQSITPDPKKIYRLLPEKIYHYLYQKQLSHFQAKYVYELSYEKYDIVFMLAGQGMTIKTMRALKQSQPNAIFIWYIWDSINNLDNYHEIKSYFNRIMSFDLLESKKYSLEYSPLFYAQTSSGCEIEYDINMIGQNRGYRIALINAVLKLSIFTKPFIYLKTAKWEKMKFICSNKDQPYFKTKNLSHEETLKYMDQSRYILDMPAPNQSGLTMRTIEALGLGKKLITTNKNIQLYDFYDSRNIFIINPRNVTLDSEFLASEYCDCPQNVLNYYHIDSWIDRILGQAK